MKKLLLFLELVSVTGGLVCLFLNKILFGAGALVLATLIYFILPKTTSQSAEHIQISKSSSSSIAVVSGCS